MYFSSLNIQILTVPLYCLQALQSVMVAREVYDHESKRLKGIEAEHQKCADKIQTAEKLASNNLKATKEVQKEFDEFANKVQSLEQSMCDEAHKVATQHVMRTRVEMILEFHHGESKSWDITDTFRFYNEAYPEDAFPLDRPSGNDDKPPSPEDVDPKSDQFF